MDSLSGKSLDGQSVELEKGSSRYVVFERENFNKIPQISLVLYQVRSIRSHGSNENIKVFDFHP